MPEPTPSILPSAQLDESISVLIVDDNSVDRHMIVYACSKLNAEVEMASTGEEAIERFKEKRHRLVITDYRMEPMNGVELAQNLMEIDPSVELILVSGSPTAEVMTFVQNNELAPVVTKPISPTSLINSAVICIERSRGRREVLTGVAMTNRMDDCLPLLGTSEVCQKLRREIADLIQMARPVLITGAVASGKLQIAHLMHRQGAYGDSLCLECHCANKTPEELSVALISESGEPGEMIQRAQKGTLIIHNIEILPMPLQQALAKEYDAITSDMNLIVVTDSSLDAMLDDGLIDDSLYFKLSLITLEVSPLADRMEDLPNVITYICEDPEKYSLSPLAKDVDVDTVLKVVAEGGLEKNFASLAMAIQRAALLSDKKTD
ncbi:MAG: sigma-54-dependent transcriptional regulator [Opitutaceae bacterium]